MLGKKRFVFYTLLILLSSTVVDAGKIFKWTDDEGNVHFGQRPPAGNKKVTAIKGIQSSVNPVERGSGLYCGAIKIQYKKNYSSNRRYNKQKYQTSAYDLEKKIVSWKRSLKHSKDNLSRYLIQISKINPNYSSRYSRSSGSDFYERKDKLTKSIAEYTCAINWAEEKALSLRVNSPSIRERYKKAKQDLSSAKKQQSEICGLEPSSYNQYGDDRNTYRAWERCQRKYGSVVRKMQRKFYDAQNGLNKVN